MSRQRLSLRDPGERRDTLLFGAGFVAVGIVAGLFSGNAMLGAIAGALLFALVLGVGWITTGDR